MTDKFDPVLKAKHYNLHPSGVECIDIIKHHNYNVGAAIKYLWRAGLKEPAAHIEDLKKARYYVDCEISMLGGDDVRTPEERFVASARIQAQEAIDRVHSMTPAAFEIAFGAQAQKADIEKSISELLMRGLNVSDPPPEVIAALEDAPGRAFPAYLEKDSTSNLNEAPQS